MESCLHISVQDPKDHPPFMTYTGFRKCGRNQEAYQKGSPALPIQNHRRTFRPQRLHIRRIHGHSLCDQCNCTKMRRDRPSPVLAMTQNWQFCQLQGYFVVCDPPGESQTSISSQYKPRLLRGSAVRVDCVGHATDGDNWLWLWL